MGGSTASCPLRSAEVGGAAKVGVGAAALVGGVNAGVGP